MTARPSAGSTVSCFLFPSAAQRRAVTLAEVLVSIMILSIGIIFIATLFPISILRSVQATQLTNATILRYNVETAIGVSPKLVFDPNGSGTPAGQAGNNYIVDPLGWNRVLDHPNASSLQGIFGNNGVAGNERRVGNLKRFSGLPDRFDPTRIRMINTSLTVAQAKEIALNNALAAVTLADSWVDFVAGEFSARQANQITISSEFDVSDIPDSPQIGLYRIVLLDADLRKSHTRIITNRTGTPQSGPQTPQTVGWSNLNGRFTDNGSIPSPFPQVGSFRIQTRDIRYTWILTVRQNVAGFEASIDVVIIFRRPDPPAGEQVYVADLNDASINAFVKDNRSATIAIPAGSEPALKKGSFIFDAQNAQWYRVQDITYSPNETNPTSATIQIDRPAIENGNAAIVMPGVIEVFPLGSKPNKLLL